VAVGDLAQYVVTGLLVGGVYALMSIGLALIFGVMRVVNFAQGDFMMLGMYLTYFLAIGPGVDPLLGALLVMPPFFLVGVLVHRILLVRVTGGGDPQRLMDAQLILTLGLSLIITNGATMLLTPMPRGIKTAYATQAFAVGPVLLNQARSYAFLMALLLETLLPRPAAASDRSADRRRGSPSRGVAVPASRAAVPAHRARRSPRSSRRSRSSRTRCRARAPPPPPSSSGCPRAGRS